MLIVETFKMAKLTNEITSYFIEEIRTKNEILETTKKYLII